MSTFLGLRGTGDWVTNQRPESWRETMLFLYPNGQAPLTAMSSMMTSEPTSDPKFHWWTKTLPLQSASITELYTDSLLSAAYANGGVEGDVLYVKTTAALASEFRPGHQVKFRKSTDHRHDTVGKVTQVVLNGASSFVAVRLLEDADGTYDLDQATNLLVIGNLNPEGGTIPEVIAYDPTEFTNVTQIFRTPLSITRTARRTRLRTPDQYTESKREALELHSIEMEKAFIWGKMYEGVGDNGKPERAMDGLVNAIKTYASGNVSAYHLDVTYTGDAWTASGETWLDSMLETIYRYGSTEKIAFCGSQVALGLKRLAKAGATVNIEPVTIDYGIRIMAWYHQFGTLYFKTHPLFNYDPLWRSDMVIFEPRNLRIRTIDDTFFVEDPIDRKNRNHSFDGQEEEFITELGFEYHFPQTMGYLSGFNIDNDLGN